MTITEELQSQLTSINRDDEKFAVKVVDSLLTLAERRSASDLHLLPNSDKSHLTAQFRIDGVLESAGTIPNATNIISRLKVISGLLTYRMDVPQEGRVKRESSESEIRVSTFPTIHGEKAVVRFFVGSGEYKNLDDLQYPADIHTEILEVLQRTSGLLLTCGPAGSGKTTMLYAGLRHILSESVSPRSICTLEDPVEAVIPGISQSQVKPETDFNYQRGLTSLMRQDPDVIMVGEIRDHETAEIVFQASLSGHLVLSTFHAGTAADALGRLADMDVEPYILRSGLTAVLAQRLVRMCCACRDSGKNGCEQCRFSGFAGRKVVAEMLKIEDADVCQAILQRQPVQEISIVAEKSGLVPILKRAQQMVVDGETTLDECLRVFGQAFGPPDLSGF